jgi:hypothetical protein
MLYQVIIVDSGEIYTGGYRTVLTFSLNKNTGYLAISAPVIKLMSSQNLLQNKISWYAILYFI